MRSDRVQNRVPGGVRYDPDGVPNGSQIWSYGAHPDHPVIPLDCPHYEYTGYGRNPGYRSRVMTHVGYWKWVKLGVPNRIFTGLGQNIRVLHVLAGSCPTAPNHP